MNAREREELAQVASILATEHPSSEDLVARAEEPLSVDATEAIRRLEALVKRSSDPDVRAEALGAMRPLLLHRTSARRVHALASAYLEDGEANVRQSAILLFSLGGGTTEDLATMTRLMETDPSQEVRLWAASAVSIQIELDRLRLPLGKSAVIDDNEIHRVLDAVERVLRDPGARKDVRSAAVAIVEALVDEGLRAEDIELAAPRTLAAIARWREANPPYDNGLEGD